MNMCSNFVYFLQFPAHAQIDIKISLLRDWLRVKSVVGEASLSRAIGCFQFQSFPLMLIVDC